MQRIIAVIPARMGSSRFPGKPLTLLLGRPMVEHVYRRTAASRLLSEVLIATCDEEIAAAARGFGATAVMTSSQHERASDRVAEATAGRGDVDVVVMVQGDEPLIRPEMIDAAVAPLLSDPDVDCVNLGSTIDTEEEFQDPNVIKVVTGIRGDALYFSRRPIPDVGRRNFEPGRWLKQVCVIPFRRRALCRFAELSPTPLERSESIDMLRFLEHGLRVKIVATPFRTRAVDTPHDLVEVEKLLAADPMTSSYLGAC